VRVEESKEFFLEECMSAKSMPLTDRLEWGIYPVYKKRRRDRALIFVPTLQKHGCTVWVDVGDMLLPCQFYFRKAMGQDKEFKDEMFLRLDRNAIDNMLSSLDIGGWTV
jgi:hypothetical protein